MLYKIACNSIKKKTTAQVFSCEFCKVLKTLFFTEHIQWLFLYVSHRLFFHFEFATFSENGQIMSNNQIR